MYCGGRARTYFPIPVKLTTCGLFASTSVLLMLPGRVPLAIGVNVTLTVQLPPAAKLTPQVSVSVYSLPLETMLDNASALVPMLVRVKLFGALLVLVVWAAKA